MPVSEDLPADASPPLRLLSPVVAVAAQQPRHVVRAPAGDHVARREDDVFLGERLAHVGLLEGPERHGGGEHAVPVDGRYLPVQAPEEAGVRDEGIRGGEGGLAFAVFRAAAPVGRHELDGGEALFLTCLQITFPVFVPRSQSPVPRRVREPEEGCAVGVLEVAAVGGEPQWTVPVEGSVALVGLAPEAAPGSVQGLVVGRGLPGPLARLVRAEPHPPGRAAVPERLDGVSLCRRVR